MAGRARGTLSPLLALGMATLSGIPLSGVAVSGMASAFTASAVTLAVPARAAVDSPQQQPGSAPAPSLTGPPAAVPAQVAVAEVLQPEALPAPLQPSRAVDADQPAHLQLAYPLAQPALQVDPWGWRYSESRGRWRMHTGVDLAADPGTAVLAALAGRVLLVESLAGYGLTVVLDHGAGVQTLYAHLQDARVDPGAWVERGQALGGVGMTGAATGPHLHFEVRHRGAELLALNPTPHLPPPVLPAVPARLLAIDPQSP